MGVSGLWDILNEAKTHKDVKTLRNEIIAVDLAMWICEAEGVEMMKKSGISNPFLRNVLFRVVKMSCHGVQLLFVADGSPPEVKHKIIAQRLGQASGTKISSRKRLNAKMDQCCNLFDALGIPWVKSEGEAEATCAALNMSGYVDACATKDGDAFLYGAKRIYRNLSAEKDLEIECYEIDDIRRRLSLDRNKLIALGLLLGCDYYSGLPGIGKVHALKWLGSLQQDEDCLDAMKQWKNYKLSSNSNSTVKPIHCSSCRHAGSKRNHASDGCSTCGFECKNGISKALPCSCVWHSEMQKQKSREADEHIIKLAKQVPGFPNEAVINEFQKRVQVKEPRSRRIPSLRRASRLASDELEWSLKYTVQKILPLLTHWMLTHLDEIEEPEIVPKKITHERKRNGVSMYEMIWEITSIEDIEDQTTLERQNLVNIKYPRLVESYFDRTKREKEEKKAKKKKSKVSSSANNSVMTDYFTKKKFVGRKKMDNAHKDDENPTSSTVESVAESLSCLTLSPIVISSDEEDICPEDVLRERTINVSTTASTNSKREQEVSSDVDNSLSVSKMQNHDFYDASADMFDLATSKSHIATPSQKENVSSSEHSSFCNPESPVFMSLTDRIRLKSYTS